ncbi:hypothetical protein WMY93_030604 [Mugilogobius chulae]|uniref:Uncharacterized protein n=1 Tax=Mugilogobius chulae TaxID=88201 RepID=A0AAW0MPD1_9GOBI
MSSSIVLRVFRFAGEVSCCEAAQRREELPRFLPLLSGASDDTLKKLKLERDFSKYNYLRPGLRASGQWIDDAANSGLSEMPCRCGLHGGRDAVCLELVAAVLKLGNIEFKPESRCNGTDESRIKDKNGQSSSKPFNFIQY